MKVQLFCFGRASEFAHSEEKRLLKRFKRFDFEVIELKESKLTGEQALVEEWKQLQKKLPSSSILVALAEEGKHPSSEEFAQQISQWEIGGCKNLILVIGSAYGLDPELKRSAQNLLSLSRMTLSHDYARVLLVEQLYRAQCILEGHPYHHR